MSSGIAGTIGIIVIILVIVAIVAVASYTVAPTDKVLVITGPRGRRFVTGRSALIIPFLYRRDWLSLGVVQTLLETEEPIPTKDALLINVSAVANFQVGNDVWVDKDGMEHNPLEMAARNYLNKDKTEMERDVQQVLLGKMREAVGKTELKTLMCERDTFAETVAESALEDMRNLGLELTTFNVQDFSDSQGVIENLGAEMAAQITKNAQLSRIKADQEVAERQNELDLKRADLKMKADKAKAEADIVYATTTAERKKELNVAEQNANIAAEERKIELARKAAAVKEQQLDAEVRKQADADAYAAKQRAEADLAVTKANAEAELYRQQKAAEATKVEADAEAHATRANAEAEAAATKAKGEARGAALAAEGKGEAEGIRAQGEAYDQMRNDFILKQQFIAILPEIARAISEPLAKVDRITMYGEGNTTRMVGDTATAMDQLTNAVADSTGLDLKSLLNSMAGGTAAGKALASASKKKEEETKNDSNDVTPEEKELNHDAMLDMDTADSRSKK